MQGVLTLFGRGKTQGCHDLPEVELKEQLEVEEEDGDRQEEKLEEKGEDKGEVESNRVRHGWNEDDCECAQNLSLEVCGVIISHETKMRAVSVHVRHASVEVQVQCVNVVIGVVLGKLLAVRDVPIVVCDDAVVRRTICSHRCNTVAIVFIVAFLRWILLYWRYFYTLVGDSKLLLAVTELSNCTASK